MTMSPPLRKFVLTLHIIFTVGWLGAVAAFLVLAIAGLTSLDALIVRASYIAMGLMAQFVIVPLSFAPLITGPILSLGTRWGLFRHYWIIVKLFLTIACTILMQVHLQPIIYLANAAAREMVFGADLRTMQVQMMIAASAALVALLLLTGLAVYKPRGMTPYGWRKQYK